MIELRQFVTPPEWTHSDLSGMLNPACHVVITYAAIDTETGDVIGKPGRHRAVLVQQANGAWTFSPHPVNPSTGKPFVFTQQEMARLLGDIAGDVQRRGVVPAVLEPVNNGDGTTTVTAVYYALELGLYARKTKSVTTPTASPDLSELADVLPESLRSAAIKFITEGQ